MFIGKISFSTWNLKTLCLKTKHFKNYVEIVCCDLGCLEMAGLRYKDIITITQIGKW